MKRVHLPLPALRAFETTGRLLSVSKAAIELCVTSGAISQQIKLLEQNLSVSLIQRNGRNIELTDAGQVLLPHLTQAFDLIGLTLDSLKKTPKSMTLRLTLLPSLAEKWLMPRLARFHGDHPELDIQMLTSFRDIQFDADGVDMASYVGSELPAGIAGVRLFDDEFLPVCSPALLAGARPLVKPSDLTNFTLLQSVRRLDDWHKWLTLAGEASMRPAHTLSFGNASLAIRAALGGMGVAVVQYEYVKDNLNDGSLVAPFDLKARSNLGYYLGWPATKQMSTACALFRDWILKEVARTP